MSDIIKNIIDKAQCINCSKQILFNKKTGHFECRNKYCKVKFAVNATKNSIWWLSSKEMDIQFLFDENKTYIHRASSSIHFNNVPDPFDKLSINNFIKIVNTFE